MAKQDFPRRALSKDCYATDIWLLKMFDGWFDPCPLNPNWVIDGLEIDWEEKTYVNPPYSNPLPWVKKAVTENHRGNTVVMLLKHDSSTQWWRIAHENGAHFLPIMGRLSYQSGKPCAFPSVLVVFA